MPFPVATDEIPLAQDLNNVLVDALEWKEFVPRLSGDGGATELDLGDPATSVGRMYRFGMLTVVTVYIEFGTSGATFGNGVYRVSASSRTPGEGVNVPHSTITDNNMRCGSGEIYDSSAAARFIVSPMAAGGGNWEFVPDRAAQVVAYNYPFLWAGGDFLFFWAAYERKFHT